VPGERGRKMPPPAPQEERPRVPPAQRLRVRRHGQPCCRTLVRFRAHSIRLNPRTLVTLTYAVGRRWRRTRCGRSRTCRRARRSFHMLAAIRSSTSRLPANRTSVTSLRYPRPRDVLARRACAASVAVRRALRRPLLTNRSEEAETTRGHRRRVGRTGVDALRDPSRQRWSACARKRVIVYFVHRQTRSKARS